MKFLWIVLVSLTLASCASHTDRNPASTDVDDGITAESYNMNR